MGEKGVGVSAMGPPQALTKSGIRRRSRGSRWPGCGTRTVAIQRLWGAGAEFGGDLSRDRCGEILGEERARWALGDCAVKQPLRCRHHKKRSDAAATCGLPEHGDIGGGVPAESCDVVVHPVQGGDLVKQATIVRCSGNAGEPLDADAVVQAHHHHTGPGEKCTILVRIGGVAFQITATVDPHHDRQPSRTGIW